MLRDEVNAAMGARQSLNEIKQTVKMASCEDWCMSDQSLPGHIEEMSTHLGGKS